MSGTFLVTGGTRLQGDITVAGAKNSALKLMALALMTEGRTVLRNCPQIADVPYMADVLRQLGCSVSVEGTEVRIDTPAEISHRADSDVVQQFRASVCVLGPLVGRNRRAVVALPGGDAIGNRPLDMHQRGLNQLGASTSIEHGCLVAEAHKLVGADIRLGFPSVGATENIVTAAVLAEGTTRLHNAAREPEIVDICTMLNEMGAQIEGAGSSEVVVHGVDSLKPVEHTVIGDRIVAATWCIGAAMTRGDVTVRGIDPFFLHVPLEKLRNAGAAIELGADSIRVVQEKRPTAINVQTLPFPGFPTDLQPMVIAQASIADGMSVITENIFESRFRFVNEMVRLGAQASTDGHHAEVHGVPVLSSATVWSSDIRAGAGLVLAGMCGDGITTVCDVHHIERGYPDFIDTVRQLGGAIERGEPVS